MAQKKLYRYDPPTSTEQSKRGRGHRVKVAAGLYLVQGKAMYLDPDLVRGVPYLTEINAQGQKVGERYPPPPDLNLHIDIPEDPDGELEAAAEAVREREAKSGKKGAGKRTFKVGDAGALEAAMAEADKPKPRRRKKADKDAAGDADAKPSKKSTRGKKAEA